MIQHPKLRAKLDTITLEHSDLLRKWRNDPKIFRWCRQNDLLTESQHADWMVTHPKNKSLRMYLIRDQADIPVGVCGLTDLDLVNQRAEFSLYISTNNQGSGIGKDALKLLCYHGFNSYPLNTIWGESFDGNPAISMFEKVGFKKEGIRRSFYFRDGKHVDAVLVSIKRDELQL